LSRPAPRSARSAAPHQSSSPRTNPRHYYNRRLHSLARKLCCRVAVKHHSVASPQGCACRRRGWSKRNRQPSAQRCGAPDFRAGAAPQPGDL
jgi:hypothetical protein